MSRIIGGEDNGDKSDKYKKKPEFCEICKKRKATRRIRDFTGSGMIWVCRECKKNVRIWKEASSRWIIGYNRIFLRSSKITGLIDNDFIISVEIDAVLVYNEMNDTKLKKDSNLSKY